MGPLDGSGLTPNVMELGLIENQYMRIITESLSDSSSNKIIFVLDMSEVKNIFTKSRENQRKKDR